MKMPARIPANEWAKIWERYKDGESSTQLAKEYSVSASSICGGLKRRGFQLRTQRETLLRGRRALTKSELDARHYQKHGEKIRERLRAKYQATPDYYREKSRQRVAARPPAHVISKVCLVCGVDKNFSAFSPRRSGKYGLRPNCKECEAAIAKNYRRHNPEKAKETDRRYRVSTPVEKRRAIRRKSEAKRLQDPIHKLKSVLRKQLVEIFNNKGIRKQESALILVGCTVAELKAHIEQQFQSGMSWSNYGLYRRTDPQRWNLDHIIPVDSFDLTDLEQRKRCFHFTNLRPLWGRENIQKSNRLIGATKACLEAGVSVVLPR